MSKRFLSACALLTAGLCVASVAGAAPRASWPSLKSQLAEDGVPAGSALEKLIASNQEFQLLRPEEANDKISIPLWLRVMWRKQHPEGEFLAIDGTGGYPLVLNELREWMASHPDLRPGPGVREPEEKKKPAGPSVSAGEDRKISENSFSPHSESDIRINYWDPSRVISASNNIRGSGVLAIYYSQDGGATWKQSSLPHPADENFQSDPTVDWTSDGTAWATEIGITNKGDNTALLHLRAWRSRDGGATWTQDTTISADQDQADKQMMWVDHSESSPFKDTIYVIWHNGRHVFVTHRSPGDGSWTAPMQISAGETLGTGIGSDIKTDVDGNVYAFWPDTGSRKIYFSRSTNGGDSFAKPVVVGSTSQSFQTDLPAQHNRGALVYVTGGVFKVGKSASVYAAWAELSGAAGCRTPVDDPRDNVNAACKNRVWFSRSTNGGTKWAKPRMINNQTSKSDQFNPWMAVDPATGQLGIMYYDTVGEERTSVNVFFQASNNGGQTWGAPVRISSAPSSSLNPDDGNQFGDYNSLSGLAGTYFPSWTDRRSQHEEIWTAPIYSPAQTATACRTVNLSAASLATGIASVRVPAGATETELALWHRREFTSGLNAGSLKVAIDGGAPVAVPASAIVAGAPLAKGRDLSPVNTVIDLDAVCRAATGGDCGGRSLRLFFSAGAEKSAAGDVWFLDDASVTSCAP
jgi:hypothetical protein